MLDQRIPVWVRHAPASGVTRFAILGAVDATAKAILLSVFPLALYRVYQDAGVVSEVYFLVGIAALGSGLTTPLLMRIVPRRWTLTLGAALYILSAGLAIMPAAPSMVLALLCHAVGGVIVFVCLNAYILDYVVRVDLGRCETLRMFYSALAWTAGPASGVWLMNWWLPAPFMLSALAAICLLAFFWWMRLGEGKLIKRVLNPAPNLLGYLGRFIRQPRLIAGWLFAVTKSSAWWVFIVYLPIYVVEHGLREDLGGIALSISNGLMFATPLMLRWMQRHSVRQAVRAGFFFSGSAFVAAAVLSAEPWSALVILMIGSLFMILLDICAGLPFLMAVKPSERAEMSAVYSIYSNVSGILTPGVAWLVLLLAPVPAVFGVMGAGLLLAWALAGRIHPRLGKAKGPRPKLGQDLSPSTPSI